METLTVSEIICELVLFYIPLTDIVVPSNKQVIQVFQKKTSRKGVCGGFNLTKALVEILQL